MRALVTGATGMLGGCLVERLVADGWDVRALVRDHARGAWIESSGARAVAGSLEDLPALNAAADGCDVVFNAAAAIGPQSDPAPFVRANVLGTANVLAAAGRTGARVVHVSSTAVFGRERYHASPTDESTPLPSLPAEDAYGRSKQEAERLALDAHAAGRVWSAVVRPPVMYGPRDRQFVPRVAPVLDRGVFPLFGGGQATLSIVHADSVAEGAIRAAATDGAGGRVYHLTNDFDLTVADFVRFAARGLGRGAFRALALALGACGRRDLARHAAGLFDMLTRGNPFASERARRELGWAPSIPPAEGLVAAFAWWKRGGR
jgi:nucleoside-diphosphate-sugar epimerase